MITAGPITLSGEEIALILGALALAALVWVAVNWAVVAFGVAVGHARSGHVPPSTHSRGAMAIATLLAAATPLGVVDAAPSLRGTVWVVGPGFAVAFALGTLIGAVGSGSSEEVDGDRGGPLVR